MRRCQNIRKPGKKLQNETVQGRKKKKKQTAVIQCRHNNQILLLNEKEIFGRQLE